MPGFLLVNFQGTTMNQSKVKPMSIEEQSSEAVQTAYADKIEALSNFIGNAAGAQYDALFLLGLQLNNLALLPRILIDEPRSYWISAPKSVTDKWEDCMIVESDCFNGE